MRTYRTAWTMVVLLTTLTSVAVGVARVGWFSIAVTALALAVLGAILGLALATPDQRWRPVRRTGTWCGVGGILMVGLPVVLGPWSLLVLLGVALSCPDLVALAGRPLRAMRGRPVRSVAVAGGRGERDLRWRWQQTAEAIRDRHRTTAEVLALVEERADLLDELERREPEWFLAWLVRSGWREPQDR